LLIVHRQLFVIFHGKIHYNFIMFGDKLEQFDNLSNIIGTVTIFET